MNQNETGIIRRIDDLGRIALPKEVRRKIGVGESTPMEIFISGNEIILKKYSPENDLLSMVDSLDKAVEDEYSALGYEKVGAIRIHIKEIKELLTKMD